MKFRIEHTSHYTYSDAVSLSHNEAYLTPLDTARQKVREFSLEITPAPTLQTQRQDLFGNIVAHFLIEEPHDELIIAARSVVETTASLLVRDEDSPLWETAGQGWQPLYPSSDPRLLAASHFLYDSPFVPRQEEIVQYARPSFEAGKSLLMCVRHLMGQIHRDFVYAPGSTTIATGLLDFFRQKRGVCQDFAHLLIACLRGLGLPARYVSGYIETLPPSGQEKLVGADASHAWVSLFIPGIGWVDADPTNNVFPSDRHIVVAVGRDYGDVTPVKGLVLGGGRHEVSVKVDVQPL